MVKALLSEKTEWKQERQYLLEQLKLAFDRQFANNPNGAKASAMLYSIVETAKANDLILYDYMVKCMKDLAKAEPDIDALLPWNFKH